MKIKLRNIKNVIIVFLLFLSGKEMYSQGNACSGAVSLTVNGTCSTGNISDATVNDPTVSTCTAETRDGWYSFVAIATSSTVTFTNTSNKDPEIFIYSSSGTCASLVYNSCVNATGTSGDETITFVTVAGTTYYIRIGRVSTTNGTLSGTTCVTSPTIPNCATITSPANNATALCSNSTSLNWTAPGTATAPTGYKLYFGTNAGATNIVNGTNIGNVLTYNPGALTANTTYYWKIVPTNAVGDAVGCTIWMFTTGNACYTQQTTTVTACGGTYYDSGGSGANYGNNESSTITFCPSVLGQQVQITFTAFATYNGADNLIVYNGPSTASSVLATLSGSSLPACAYTSSDPGGCLTFKFTSNGNNNSTGWTASIACVAAPPAPVCSAITSPVNNATGICSSSATLNWSAPTGCGAPSGYLLYFGTDAAATNIVNGTNVGNVLTYNPGGLSVSTVYYWKIVPTNSGGTAAGCTINSFTTGATACYTQQTGTFTSCGGHYYDSGGSGSNYTNNENSTITFCPGIAGQFVDVTFNSFTIESGFDNLIVYNGPSTASPLINTYTGNTLPCDLTSTAVGGCLTFNFTSDGSVVYSGWDAVISCVTVAAGAFAGSTCANAPAITLPYIATTQTTACYGNDYTNASTGSCGTSYESGEDRVYAYTAVGSECISISLTNTNTNSIGFQVYSGCPGTAGTTCVGNSGGATSGSLTGSVTLPGAGTYYIIVDTWSTPFNANYDISITSFGTSVVNDLPCNATLMTLGSSEPGDNSCSGSSGEPAVPSCWTAGTVNSVWYKIVAPASGSLKIKTYVSTLTNTQIAIFSGTCGAGLTMLTGGCNNDASSCGGLTNYNSEIDISGLTAGTTYYIEVDGTQNLVGTFSILAIDGSTTFPPITGMDCVVPNLVCTQSFSVANPGYSGFGNICDLPYPATTGDCLASAERNIVWYTVPINAAGNLTFDIVPNDFNPTTLTYTDYDFGIWKISGTGAVTCSQIASGAGLPTRCNYSALGITGCFGTTTNTANTAALSNAVCPQCYPPGTYSANPSFNGAYETQIAVISGDVYLLGVSNYTSSTSGFSIDFGASPIGYVGTTATSVTWTGGTDTDPTKPSNWGGCNIPSCSIDAIVAAFITEPVVTSSCSVKSVTIQPGATLTVNAGVTLTVCGDFTNNGSLVMSPTSTILFSNTNNHIVSGNLTGSNGVGNLTITQTAGSVSVLNDIDIKGSFTASNSTSIFNSNGNYVKVAQSFVNNAGNTTFTNIGTTGTLEFNGTSGQTYNQGSAQLDLNNVVINNTSTGVTLNTNMYLKSGTSALTLTQGKIITNAFEVNSANIATTSVSTGNTTSFVQGNLRRYISSTGAYDFPVGHSVKGYQLANINFTAGTSIGNLLARFDSWTITPCTQGGSECASTYNLPAEDNGWWTITADANPLTGTYSTTLYPLNAANTGGASGWSVMKSDVAEAGPWLLNGNCNGASTATIVIRDAMNGFSRFGVSQATAPLPIELLSFTGRNAGNRNLLEWTTASETNNDYFTVEHSETAANFVSCATVPGAGNSTHNINYSAYDNTPWTGITYYRLKQTDYNGRYKYSDIISVDMNNNIPAFDIVNTFTSPESGLEVTVNCSNNCELSFELYDMIGRLVYESKQNAFGINTKIILPVYEFSKGIYLLKAYNGEKVVTRKIVN